MANTTALIPTAGAAHMADRLTRHRCGGTVLTGGQGEHRHVYCDCCRAFAYRATEIPNGTDVAANRAAWDAGEETSPPESA